MSFDKCEGSYTYGLKEIPRPYLPNQRSSIKLSTEDINFKDNYSKKLLRTFKYFLPLPALKSFPTKILLLFGSITYISLAVLFLFFLVHAFVEHRSRKFLSLENISSECHSTSPPLSGTFLASTSGHWEGNSNFKYSEAAFKYSFQGISFGADFQRSISDTLNPTSIGSFTSTHDLIQNLVSWLHYRTISEVNGMTQQLSLTGSTQTIFNRQTISGTLQNETDTCRASSTTFLSTGTTGASLLLSFPPEDGCGPLLGPLRAQDPLNSSVDRVELDLSSLSLAVAVNLGIVPLGSLEMVNRLVEFTIEGVIHVAATYIDPGLNQKEPLLCVSSGTPLVHSFCYYLTSGLPAIPILTHLFSSCVTCDLKDSLSDAEFRNCNSPMLVVAAVFVGEEEFLDAIRDLIAIVARNEVDSIRRKVSDLYREGSTGLFDQVCLGFSCSIVTAFLHDQLPYTTSHLFAYEDGHCNDAISLSYAETALLVETPPTHPNVYPLYECQATVGQALLYSVGLSIGDTFFFGFFLLLLLLPLFYFIARGLHLEPEPQVYPSEQLKDQSKLLAKHFLRVKEKDLRVGLYKEDDLILTLVRQLSRVEQKEKSLRNVKDSNTAIEVFRAKVELEMYDEDSLENDEVDFSNRNSSVEVDFNKEDPYIDIV